MSTTEPQPPSERAEQTHTMSPVENRFPLTRLAVLASGSGSTFEAIAQAVKAKKIPADYLLLISNNPSSGASARASKLGVDAIVIDSSRMANEEYDQRLLQTLLQQRIGLVFLAGYLRKIGPAVLKVYANRILNTHPALLPDDPAQRKYGGAGMYGTFVHQAVLAAGEQISGATVHLVDADFDHGLVLERAEVDISKAATAEAIGELVQGVEKKLVVSVLGAVLEGKIALDGN